MASVIDTVAVLNTQKGKQENSKHPAGDSKISKKTSVPKHKKIRPSLSVQDIKHSVSSDDKKHDLSRKDKPQVSSVNSPVSKLPSTSDLSSSTKVINGHPSPSLMGRRTTSTDLLTLTHKSSGSSQTPSKIASKLSFSSVTKRVSTLLKFRRGLLSGHGDQDKKPPSPPPDPLPAKPRFSAFMSAEAQFALLKGYEDILAAKLVDQYPTERALIQRTKTPRHSIAISEFGLEHAKPSPWVEKRRSLVGLIPKDGLKDLKPLAEMCTQENGEKVDTDLHSNNLNTCVESGHKGMIRVNSIEKDEEKVGINTETRNQCEKAVNSLSKQTCTSNIAGKIIVENSRAINIIQKEKNNNISPESNTQDHVSSFPLHGNHAMNLSDPKTNTLISNQDQPGNCEKLQNGNLPKPHRTHRAPSLPEAVVSPLRSLPRNLSHDRLLMMTHRIEKAMDILDTLKPGTELALSPRVKCTNSETDKRQQQQQQQPVHYRLLERRHSHGVGIEPVRDFNRWAGQWSREFRLNSIN